MNTVSIRKRIRSAVILVGGQSPRLSPLTRYFPLHMFPLLNRPILEYTVDLLKQHGIENIIVAGAKESDGLGHLHPDNNGNNIRYFEDERPMGTAGILKRLRKHIGDESFLVVNRNVIMHGINLDDLLDIHNEKNSVLTVGVSRNSSHQSEGVSVNVDGVVDSFSILHPSRERRSSWKPAGIYMVNPIALDFVEENKYFDIKEQLIPALRNASLSVYMCPVTGYYKSISSFSDYYEVHSDLLCNGFKGRNLQEVATDVWAAKDAVISPRSYILGPVIIGNHCSVEENAQIVGPAVIGDGCRIGDGAIVRESILWDGVSIGKDSRVQHCIVGQGLHINGGNSFNKNVVVDNLKTEDINILPSRHKFESVTYANFVITKHFRYNAYLAIKRIVDIMVAAVSLTLFFPVVLLIAAAIKLDSSGPIIFRQLRCGKGGKNFGMLKFRTMVKDAEKMQQKLLEQNEVDGPMFKLKKDPRITRVGDILRKTSLDEIPQLINVLKGDMSLVGPRPLAMTEMKFSPTWRDVRLKVRPGITGLWQVAGRSNAPFHDWIRYDITYVKRQSIWLDIKILIKTFTVVFKKIGAY